MGWIVLEGYLQCKHEDSSSYHDSVNWRDAGRLQERFFVLNINRRLEVFENNTKANRVESCYVVGFCGWDGGGLLKADTHGLELKIEKNPHKRMFLAPFNRLDLDKWCRALLAVVDPKSAAGEEVRRERRKLRKEVKRKQLEQDEKVRKWKEHQEKLAERERQRLLAREEAIKNMTPLERIDGLGSLDDETLRLLEKRRQRVHRRQATTMGRVNKSAFRKRLEDGAGGKLDNVQPLPSKRVDTHRIKTKVELPPPGQFIEVSGIPKDSFSPSQSNSSDSESSISRSDNDAEAPRHLSSQSMSSWEKDTDASPFHPPPPPPPPLLPSTVGLPPPHLPVNAPAQPLGIGLSCSNSTRSSFDRSSEKSLNMNPTPAANAPSVVDPSTRSVEDQLASILGGSSNRFARSKLLSSGPEVPDNSVDESASPRSIRSRSTLPKASEEQAHLLAVPTRPSNPMTATLAAIRKKRPESNTEPGAARNWNAEAVKSSRADYLNGGGNVRNRTRDSQLSAEGKELLKKAMGNDSSKTAHRKGLFDDSSSDEDDELEAFSSRSQPPILSSQAASLMVTTSKSFGTALSGESSDETSSDEGTSAGFDGCGMGLTEGECQGGPESFMTHRPSPDLTASPKSMSPKQCAEGSDDIQITVSFVSSNVVREGTRKPIGKFTFVFSTPDVTHEFTSSYHELEAIHTRLGSEFGMEILPKFPPKHWYRNNTKPENLQKRAYELAAYFQQLIRVPSILRSERFHMEFQTNRRFREAILGKLTPKTPVPSRIKNLVDSHSIKQMTKSSLFASDSNDSDESDSSAEAPEPIAKRSFEHEKNSDVNYAVRRQSTEEIQSQSTVRLRPSSQISVVSDERQQRLRPNSSASPKKSRRKDGSEVVLSATAPVRSPNPFGAGRGQLLAAIRQGKELKKVESAVSNNTSNSTLKPNPDNLMRTASISSSAGIEDRVTPVPAPLNPGASISDVISNAMAARRIHVEYDERSVDSGDSDDDWD